MSAASRRRSRAGKTRLLNGGHGSIETGRNRLRAKIEAGMNSRTSGPAASTADAATSEAPAHKSPALAEGFVLLDDSTSLEAVSQLFEHPVEIIRADAPADVDSALAALQAGLSRGLHAAGFFAYELGYLLEPKLASLLPAQRKVPLLWFGLYTSPRELTGAEVQGWLTEEAIGNPSLGELAHSWDSVSYLKRFEKVASNIRSGDIYQLNLTFKAKFNLSGSPLALYRDLRLKQRVAYGGLVDTGDATILSASPELFIEQHGRTIETRPMKGTAPRAGTLEADAEASHTLSTDVKNRAENLMIVDLMRNDLGRIADPGSRQRYRSFYGRDLQNTAPDDLRRPRPAEERHWRRRYPEGDLPAGLRDGRPENSRDGTYPRIGNGAARRLLRRHRPLFPGWIGAFQRRYSNSHYRSPWRRRNGHRLRHRRRLRWRQRVRRVSSENEVPDRSCSSASN